MSMRPIIIALLLIAITGCQREIPASSDPPPQPNNSPHPSRFKSDRLRAEGPIYRLVETRYIASQPAG